MNHKIFFCGIGSLGSWLFRALIFREELREHRFVVIDCDRIEDRNVGNQVYTVGQVGLYKTQGITQLLIDWGLRDILSRVEFLTGFLDKHFSIPFDIGLIIDCFDNYESRLILQEFGEKYNIPVIHCGFAVVDGKPMARLAVDDVTDFKGAAGQDVCDLKSFSGFFQGVGAVFADTVVKYLETREPFYLTVGYNLLVKDF